MGWLALVLGAGALVAALLPAPGMFVAMGLGIAGVGVGWAGYRRRGEPGARRLAGGAAMAVAGIALALALVRYGLTLAAIDRIERMLGAAGPDQVPSDLRPTALVDRPAAARNAGPA